MEEVTGE